MKGILFAIVAGILFAFYQLSIKLSATYIEEILGAVILQAVAVVVGVLTFFIIKEPETSLAFSKTGLRFAIFAGIFVSLAEIASFYAFSQNLSPSVGITLIVGANILIGLLLDFLWFKSNLSVQQYLGMILVLLGVVLISWNTK